MYRKKMLFLIPVFAFLFTSCDSTQNKENNINKAYSITWKNYDGSVLEIDRNVPEGTFPSYDGDLPKKPNEDGNIYTFKGWSPSLSTVISDVTYTAQFSSNIETITIYFNLNGGFSSSFVESRDVNSIDSNDFFFDVTKQGFNFRGWECNGIQIFNQYGEKLSDPVIEKIMEFKAIYSDKAELSIFTNIEECANIYGDGEYDYNSEVHLVASPYQGYSFVGWYDGDTLLSSSSEFTYLLWNKDIKLEARFKCNTYKLEVKAYNYDFGSINVVNHSSEYSSSYSERFDYLTNLTLKAYSKSFDVGFLGWFDDENNLLSQDIQYSFKMPNFDYKIFAKWNLFEISLVSNIAGAGVLTGQGNYSFGEKVLLSQKLQQGYVFNGWYDSANNLLSKESSFEITVGSLNETFTAKYDYDLFRLSISFDKVIGNVLGEGEYAYNSLVTIEALPSEMYTFEGWYLDNELLSSNAKYTFVMPNYDLSLNAKFIGQNCYIGVSTRNSKNGSGNVSGAGTYRYNTNCTITAIPNNGYYFNGWYDSSYKKITSDSEYTFVVKKATTFYAEFLPYTFNLLLTVNDENMGTVSGGGVKNYNDTYYLEASPNDGYRFVGWYDVEGNCLSNNTRFSFTMPMKDTELLAKFEADSWDLILKSSDDKKGTVSGGGSYIAGESVTIHASCSEEYLATTDPHSLRKAAFTGWYIDNGTCVSTSETYTFNMPRKRYVLTARFDGKAKEIDDSIYFGTYPQTMVEDEETLSLLSKYTYNTPYSTRYYNWTLYDHWYDYNGNPIKVAWYLDIDVNSDNVPDYRAVYFTEYQLTSYEYFSGSDNENYKAKFKTYTVYYFKYEPIEWNIVASPTSEYSLLCSKVIDSQPFDSNITYADRTVVCYKDSYLRTFLNSTLYNGYFNTSERSKIKSKQIDTTYYDERNGSGMMDRIAIKSSCTDYIYILSKDELKKINYTDYHTDYCEYTNYAEIMNLYVYEREATKKDEDGNIIKKNMKCCDWWLRDSFITWPNTNEVYTTGYIRSPSARGIGVRPSLCISR